MDTIDKFVGDARAKGLTDDHIKQMLIDHGWSKSNVEAALIGVSIPQAPHSPAVAAQKSSVKSHTLRSSISSLEAALQHIFLWVFTVTSSVMLITVISIIFGSSPASSKSLLTYLVLETVTFSPFVILFIMYLRQFNKNQELSTGRIWSTITIVLHSLGAMGSIVVFLLSLVLVSSYDDRTPFLISAVVIGSMNIAVVVAYILTSFTKNKFLSIRRKLLYAFPAFLFLIIASFGILALMHVGPMRSDDQTRRNLVETVKTIKTYTQANDKLPADISSLKNIKSGITYKKNTSSTYSLCADFKVDTQKGNMYTADYRETIDESVADYSFSSVQKGQNCFNITASALKAPEDTYAPFDDTMDIY
jgi:hypothetical protein